METIRRINGNGEPYVRPLPKLVILGFMNDGALNYIFENTGLNFQKGAWETYEAIPNSTNQIVTLIMTYNFKTQYHDNASNQNTLFLKHCNNEGFKVDSICFECVKANHIHAGSLTEADRLAV